MRSMSVISLWSLYAWADVRVVVGIAGLNESLNDDHSPESECELLCEELVL